LGPRSPDEVAQALAAADVFALASRYEGCPNVLLEALASGRPVVAPDVGEIPRLVTEAGGVVYGRADDQLALLQALRQVLSAEWSPQSVRASVAERTWQRTANEVLEIWSRALHYAHSQASD
jgi:glycosyltransferase involved in cell wall biosynthesis